MLGAALPQLRSAAVHQIDDLSSLRTGQSTQEFPSLL